MLNFSPALISWVGYLLKLEGKWCNSDLEFCSTFDHKAFLMIFFLLLLLILECTNPFWMHVGGFGQSRMKWCL